MAKYRKKPVVIDAKRWWKHGDNKDVKEFLGVDFDCEHCGKSGIPYHGWIQTLEGNYIVCPGDWIITGIAGEKYPCKPDIFEATYEKV